MKIIADECIDSSVVEALRAEGREVIWIAEFAPSIKDPAVLEISKLENALLITTDLDFGELVYRQKLGSYGIVLLRLYGLSARLKGEIVSRAFDAHLQEFWGSFTVIEPGAIRIRRMLPLEP